MDYFPLTARFFILQSDLLIIVMFNLLIEKINQSPLYLFIHNMAKSMRAPELHSYNTIVQDVLVWLWHFSFPSLELQSQNLFQIGSSTASKQN